MEVGKLFNFNSRTTENSTLEERKLNCESSQRSSIFVYTEKNSSRNFTQLLAKLGHIDKLEIIISKVTIII